MIFGPALLDADLVGAVLAHRVKLPGLMIPKGATLDAAKIEALRASGRTSVIVARLEPDDVAEAEAARQIGACLTAPFIRVAAPLHGRVNLFAETAGLLRLDIDAIVALNALDEAITLGTLPDAVPVAAGDMLATLKIIPFAVPAGVLARAQSMLATASCLAIRPFQNLRVGLVSSRLPHLKDSVIRSTVEATRRRVEARGGVLLPPLEAPHETAPLARAVGELLGQNADLILIVGASAVTDRADVTPASIVASGGVIERFGMPVDPGNLLCFGRIGAVPAIVMPGCARSPKQNGIDFVLDRVFAGETMDSATIARLGIGGLLKDFAPRPVPRTPRLPSREKPSSGPAVAVVVLAAGRSSRAAPVNKLLATLPDGRTLIATTVDHMLASRAGPVIVVTGHQADAVRAALGGRDVRFVHADRSDAGMAESLKAGIDAVPMESAAALVCLGDMPLVDAATIDRIIAAFDPDEGRAIVVPTHRGQRGNPVLWDRRFFAEIAALDGDAGAKTLLTRHAEMVTELAMDTDATIRDFDTADALKEIA